MIRTVFGLLLLAVLGTEPARADTSVLCDGSLHQLAYTMTGNVDESFSTCNTFLICQQPIAGEATYALSPGCDPLSSVCAMTATVPVKFPSNHRNDPTIVGGAYSFAEVDLLRPATGNSDRCGNSGDVIRQDLGFATVTAGVTCADPAASRFTLFFTSCPQLSCENGISRPLDFAKAAGCPAPIPESCNESGGTVAGASGPSCPICRRTGGDAGCAVSIVGVLACADNANEGIDHVWLITRGASFREFTNLAAGSGLRLYQGTAPSDEYRKLYYDTASGAWQLKGLDGSVEFFRSDGRWSQTIVPSDPAHPTVGIYDTDGQLARVTFPDGRSEDYTYYAVGGKLKTITENTVGGVAARTWTYLWSDDHLTGIQRPDGTAWELTYGTNGAPADGLSQVRLIGTDGVTGRVMAAFGYDTAGRVKESWRGDPSFLGINAVDKQTFTYTGSSLVTQSVVSQIVSAAFTNTTTFNLGRDTVSSKVKVLSMNGNCPTCGLAPNTTFEYNNPGGAQPLLPSAMIDGRQIRTEYTYNANGRILTRRHPQR